LQRRFKAQSPCSHLQYGAQSPDDRCYNLLRLPGVPIRHIAHRIDHGSAVMKALRVKPVRCAIYTKVFTEHGLDQEFNSLDAQCEIGKA
jgi:hypothetical protein